MIKQIEKEDIQKAFKELEKRLFSKLEKKGYGSFNSIWEIVGKLNEEFLVEAMAEVHKKDHDKLSNELLDVTITALWGYISIKSWKK